ncbi:restriction endonuclease subunit S [Lactococcus lactis]|uniref:restriction endonuclease subunit S n=1 Tax=Lactococcus lactis TaxID=1358 RepID=UPI00285E4784|nr:restriction endonuclease subunit S [Lactococcus lactis]MDR7697819.1 restriction endonuclease subunit S [Lactococcus lactis]
MAKIDDSVKKKVPELRFKGFTDEWEERKLKELGDIQTGNTPPTSNLDNYSTDGVLWVTPTDIKMLVISDTAKKLSEVGVTKARIAKAGSILVTSIASIGKNTLVTMDAGFNQQINSLTPTPKNDSYFLLTQSEKWSEKMKKTAASATMQIVNKTDFSNISTFVPVHKEEQQKIGSFFKQLDDTIALHQRKLDLLKEQKKGFLQKMFPKNGAKVPELRFAGFADDWEERKLGEVSKYSNGGSYENDVVENGTYELITLKSVNMSGKLVSSGKFINRETKTLEKDTLVMILSEQAPGLLGMTAKIPENNRYVLNQRVAEIKPNTNIDSYFLSMSINRSQAYFSKRGAGTKVQNISKPNVENFEFYCPSEREQQKIGSFFKQLDNTIALHQRKLDLLKEQKKGFLQKMFV